MIIPFNTKSFTCVYNIENEPLILNNGAKFKSIHYLLSLWAHYLICKFMGKKSNIHSSFSPAEQWCHSSWPHTCVPMHTHTHTLSGPQCFFIIWPRQIINEGLGGYAKAKPRRMSVQRKNYLFRRKNRLGRTGSRRRNSFCARIFSIPCRAQIKWVSALPISSPWIPAVPLTSGIKGGTKQRQTCLSQPLPHPHV